MADDILNDPRVSVGGAPSDGPRIEVRPKSPEPTTLQSLPTDAGTGGAASSPAGAPTGAEVAAEAPSSPSPAGGAPEGSGNAEAPWLNDEVLTDNPAAKQPSPEEAPWVNDTPLHAEGGSQVGTFASQAAASAVEHTPSTLGAIAGASIGAEAGMLGGPLAPITVPVGALAGGLIGGVAGSFADRPVGNVYRNLLSIPRVEDLPDNLKTFGYGGEFFGSVIPMAAAPLTAARTGWRFAASRVGNYLNKFIDYAQSAPRAVAMHEAAGAVGGTAGTMMMRSALPHDDTAAAIGGIVGGFLSPTRLAQTAAAPAVKIIERVYTQFSEAGRQTAAAKIIAEAVKLAGEDPSVLAQILRENGRPYTAGTAAQITGSQALADIEATLASKDQAFKGEAGRSARDAYESIRHLISLLKGTGDPAALTAVAQLRQEYFRSLLAGLIARAEAKAAASAQAITHDTPAAYAELSKQVSEAVEAALKQAREAEHYLWQQIPSSIPSPADNVVSVIADIKANHILSAFGERLPTLIEDIETALTNPLKSGNMRGMTSGELLLLRTRMLKKARSADAQGHFDEAFIYGRIAEAALDDLGAIGGAFKDKVDTARSFSRELHDAFTRTFAGDTAAVNAKGADRIPPELVLRRALGSGAEGGDLRLSQLADATDFMAKKGWAAGAPEEVFGKVGVIRESVDRLLRLAASDSIELTGPNAGRVSLHKLARWIAGHDAILNRFPEVRKVLQQALDDTAALKRLEATAKNIDPVIEQRSAFAKIVNVDSPGIAISKAVRSDLPETNLLALANVAKAGGPQAVEGMKVAAWDHVFTQAREADDSISFVKLKQAFFDPMAPGVPSLMDTLIKGGIVSPEEAANVSKLIEAAERVQAGTKGVPGGTHQEFNPLLGAIIRTLGSRIGGFASKHVTGSSTLIAQSAGARYLQGVFSKMGIKSVQATLMQLVKDPEVMADILENTQANTVDLPKAMYVHAYLLGAGTLSLESQQHLDQPDLDFEPGRFQRDQKTGDGQQHEAVGQASAGLVNGGASKLDYPTEEDAKAALDAHADYATGFETAIREGRVTDAGDVRGDLGTLFKRLSQGKKKPDARMVNFLGRALVATRRDPIAGLGFNPNNVAVEKSGKSFTLGGAYDAKRDMVLAMTDDPSAVVHESIHRGLHELLASGKLTKEEKDYINTGINNELIVRYIMATKMGDTEGSEGDVSAQQRDAAVSVFTYLKEDKAMLEAIEAKAAKLVAERRPGGPT